MEKNRVRSFLQDFWRVPLSSISYVPLLFIFLHIAWVFALVQCDERGLIKTDTPENTILSFNALLSDLSMERKGEGDALKKVLVGKILDEYMTYIGRYVMGKPKKEPLFSVTKNTEPTDPDLLNEVQLFVEYVNQIRIKINRITLLQDHANADVFFFDQKNLVQVRKNIHLQRKNKDWFIVEITPYAEPIDKKTSSPPPIPKEQEPPTALEEPVEQPKEAPPTPSEPTESETPVDPKPAVEA